MFKFIRFKRLVRYAYNNSNFYKSHYDQAGFHPSSLRTRRDYSKVPHVTREHLKSAPKDNLLTSTSSKLSMHTTSGSSGVSVAIYSDFKSHLKTLLAFLFAYKRIGVGFFTTIIALRDPIDIKPPNLIQKLGIARHQYYSIYTPISSTYEDLLRRYTKISALKGYPTDLAALASIVRSSTEFPKVKMVITDSEMLDAATRVLLESTFNAPVIDFYASVETGLIANQSIKSGSYRVSNSVVASVAHTTSEEVSNSYPVVLTGLNNKITPIIKYQIGDFIEVDSSFNQKVFSRKQLITRIEGKYLNFIVLPSKKIVSAHVIKQELTHNASISAFQFHQLDLNSADLRIQLKSQENRDALISDLKNSIENFLENEVIVNVVEFDFTQVRKTRKFMAVKSDIAEAFMAGKITYE
jgi:phenylacetate-CoA ligase